MKKSVFLRIGEKIKAALNRDKTPTTKATDERWTLTDAGREYLHGKATGRVVYVPVYRNTERMEGKPSINTPEGWAALKQRMEAENECIKKDIA